MIGFPAVLVAVLIGVTVPDVKSATYTVLPSGVIAIGPGCTPTLMARPGVLVLVAIGVTVPRTFLFGSLTT